MRSRSVACVAALALATAAGCAGDESGPESPGARVLVIGIDGATLRIARPLMNEGRLPNLTAMARAGHFGPLRAHFPLHSPRIWTSMATGKLPRKHGIEGFAYTDEKGVKRLFLSSDRKTHAIWNIASDAGLTVGVVNWWNTFPLEIVNGVMVSDHLLSFDFEGRREVTGAAPVAHGPIAYPEAWHERVRELLATDEALTDVPDPFAGDPGFPDWIDPARLSKRYRGDEAVARVALAVEREISPDLMLVFLPGIDRVSHFLWAAVEPASAYDDPLPMTASERRAMAGALDRYYEFTDRLIGRLSEPYGPDDLVMVVSDHGFEAGRPMGDLTGTHESRKALNGVIFARGARVGKALNARPISVNDITPTILAFLGLPLARDMDGVMASFLSAPSPPKPVASYDRGEVARVEEESSGAEEEILRQLQALGYMEPATPTAGETPAPGPGDP